MKSTNSCTLLLHIHSFNFPDLQYTQKTKAILEIYYVCTQLLVPVTSAWLLDIRIYQLQTKSTHVAMYVKLV